LFTARTFFLLPSAASIGRIEMLQETMPEEPEVFELS
jgi:hypothetical protein